ncbi:MAG TPA: EF-P lysine aminoacylase EpmA [Polyangiaceae bacterium]|nr:EF-P lysine aminoacylase EpmA [Polyangiaceae bacterium]
MADETLSPADLAGRALGERVRVGGRVLASAPGALVVADALGALRVALEPAGASAAGPGDATGAPAGAKAERAAGPDDATGAEAAGPGDLVVVEGRLAAGGRLEGARVAFRQRPAGPHDAPGGDVRRLLHGGVGRALAARALALGAVRSFFDARGFVEVETPLRVPCPGLDPHLVGVPAGPGRYLITSPEYQMKRLLAGGVPRCYQLARCFRGDESGRLHEPEFTMLEWYRSFAGVDDVMADTEAIVRAAAAALGRPDRLESGGLVASLEGPFARVTVAEAFARYAGVGEAEMLRLAAEDETAYFRVFVEAIEPSLAALGRPAFVVDFPVAHASLARQKPADPRYAERFELYAAGVELCNGFGELTDPAEQRARFERDLAARRERGLAAYPIDERFLAALAEGMPPSAGNALGFDRLVALALGAPSVGAVMAFPDATL